MKYKVLKEAALQTLIEEDGVWHKEHTLIDPSLPGGGQGTYEFDSKGDLVDYEPDELDYDYFCTNCNDDKAGEVKTEREWAEMFIEDGDLPSNIDLDQFDNKDRICYKCAKKALRSYY